MCYWQTFVKRWHGVKAKPTASLEDTKTPTPPTHLIIEGAWFLLPLIFFLLWFSFITLFAWSLDPCHVFWLGFLNHIKPSYVSRHTKFKSYNNYRCLILSIVSLIDFHPQECSLLDWVILISSRKLYQYLSDSYHQPGWASYLSVYHPQEVAILMHWAVTIPYIKKGISLDCKSCLASTSGHFISLHDKLWQVQRLAPEENHLHCLEWKEVK